MFWIGMLKVGDVLNQKDFSSEPLSKAREEVGGLGGSEGIGGMITDNCVVLDYISDKAVEKVSEVFPLSEITTSNVGRVVT